ncbi:MAG: lipase maturation factor family protein [Gemmatimonadota bacterium]|nr:lipase maturation factor family protein [Gemmatimonadota bacterium]
MHPRRLDLHRARAHRHLLRPSSAVADHQRVSTLVSKLHVLGQIRLDWLMWFVPLSPPAHQHWFVPLIRKLLQGESATLALMAGDPFPEGPPRWIRAGFWRYRFTTPAERRETGAWWSRTPEGIYLPATALGENGGLVTARSR